MLQYYTSHYCTSICSFLYYVTLHAGYLVHGVVQTKLTLLPIIPYIWSHISESWPLNRFDYIHWPYIRHGVWSKEIMWGWFEALCFGAHGNLEANINIFIIGKNLQLLHHSFKLIHDSKQIYFLAVRFILNSKDRLEGLFLLLKSCKDLHLPPFMIILLSYYFPT